jgi:DNA polymerase III subunit epsilon
VAQHDKLEDMAKLLENSGDYRVLRRLPSHIGSGHTEGPLPHIGIVLDTETTGLDHELDQVIELGMVKFHFASDGRIGPIVDRFQAFQEPESPLSDEIARLTGLTAGDLYGQAIDPDAVAEFVREAALVIAHNAAFDRPFSERLSATFANLPWACSATDINWKTEGVSSYRLENLLGYFGYFHDAHRAIADCEALLFILSQPLPVAEGTGFAALLRAARHPAARIFAEGAPFDARHALKRRGYQWNDGQNGYPRAWWRDVDPDAIDDELAFLASHETHPEALVMRMSARDRFRSQVRS